MHVQKLIVLVVATLALLVTPPLAWPDPEGLDLVRYGEDALTFSSGVIRQSLPSDGAVWRLTGDNRTTGNRRMVSRGEIVYLALHDPDSASSGDLYTLYRPMNDVYHPSDRRRLGRLFIITGVVEIVEGGQNPVSVKILESYHAIFPGDGAMRFVPPPPPDRGSERTQIGGEGVIVAFPDARTMVADHQVVYIDWGRAQGLRAGDRLEVFRDGEGLPRRVLGNLKVLGVGEHTSTALIANARYPLVRGDRFLFKEPAPELAPFEEPLEIVEEVEEEPQRSLASQLTNATSEAQFEETDEGVRLVLEGLVEQLTFDSGAVVIKPEGQEVLARVGKILKEVVGDKQVRVEGHADNVPIGPILQNIYATNWELSTARANEVLRHLSETGDLETGSVSAVGYSDTQPVATNATEPGREKNRRVEIVVYRSAPPEPSAEPEPIELEPIDFGMEPVVPRPSAIEEEAGGEPELPLDTVAVLELPDPNVSAPPPPTPAVPALPPPIAPQ